MSRFNSYREVNIIHCRVDIRWFNNTNMNYLLYGLYKFISLF
jgi:hypothetical protein